VKKGAVTLDSTTFFTSSSAGFDLAPAPTVANGVCSSDSPFFFSFPVPEGNYRVTLTLGGKQASTVTVRTEARRLMLEKVHVAAGLAVIKAIDINVRVPEFSNPDGSPSRVQLTPGEVTSLDWDQKLTLEFNGVSPSFHSLTIEPLTGPRAVPVVYLAGDSTVADRDSNPSASWGQQLPRFFPGVVIANYAADGDSTKLFLAELRFAKIMSVIKPGDYLFLQFAHFDEKIPNFLAKYHTLMTQFITAARDKGATPVIVTPADLDSFDDQSHIRDTFNGYIQAAREVAADTHTALIDLNQMSETMFQTMFDALGPKGPDQAFMKYPANTFPGQKIAIDDSTLFNNYGAYELARCIVQGIRDSKLPLAKFLDPSIAIFNPAKPDPLPTFSLPDTPTAH
jgi:hypothetical protein